MIYFDRIYIFFFLLLILFTIWFYIKIITKRKSHVKYSNISLFSEINSSWRVKFLHVPFIIRILTLILFPDLSSC